MSDSKLDIHISLEYPLNILWEVQLALDAPKFEDTDRKLAKVNQLMGVKP